MTSRRFKKPTIPELKQYISEVGAKFDALHFFDYYESVDWKVGKKKMTCWKAAVRTWMRNDKRWSQQRKQQENKSSSNNFKNMVY